MPPTEQGSSPLANVAAVLLLVAGVLTILFSAIMLLVGVAGAELIWEIDPTVGSDAPFVAAISLVIGLVLLVTGILQIASAIGVLAHKTWGRWLGVVGGTAGLVFGFLILLVAFVPPAAGSVEIAIALIWIGAHGFVIAALVAAGRHFQPKYPGR